MKTIAQIIKEIEQTKQNLTLKPRKMTLEQLFDTAYTQEACLAETAEKHLELISLEVNEIEDTL